MLDCSVTWMLLPNEPKVRKWRTPRSKSTTNTGEPKVGVRRNNRSWEPPPK